MKKNIPKDLLKVGFLVMFLSIIFLSTKLSYDLDSTQKTSTGQTTPQNLSQQDNQESPSGWDIYTNEEYYVKFSHPRFLLKRVYEKTGGYELFVVFEENELSLGKGVAFGVGKTGLEEEVERIKSGISKEGNTRLSNDENIVVSEMKARLLSFESQEKFLENRSFLIIEKDSYTYSISTVPEQMQKIIDSLEFLD